MDLHTEILSPEELAEITGCKQKAAQIAWLERWGWKFVTTAAGEPRVGRVHARQMLGARGEQAGPTPWSPDLRKVS